MPAQNSSKNIAGPCYATVLIQGHVISSRPVVGRCCGALLHKTGTSFTEKPLARIAGGSGGRQSSRDTPLPKLCARYRQQAGRHACHRCPPTCTCCPPGCKPAPAPARPCAPATDVQCRTHWPRPEACSSLDSCAPAVTQSSTHWSPLRQGCPPQRPCTGGTGASAAMYCRLCRADRRPPTSNV